MLQNGTRIVIQGRNGAQGKKRGARKQNGASLLDSAPSDSSDDSGPVLTKPPSRLGGTAIGDFGGRFLLHLSLGPPKLLGTSARLLFASAPLPRHAKR